MLTTASISPYSTCAYPTRRSSGWGCDGSGVRQRGGVLAEVGSSHAAMQPGQGGTSWPPVQLPSPPVPPIPASLRLLPLPPPTTHRLLRAHEEVAVGVCGDGLHALPRELGQVAIQRQLVVQDLVGLQARGKGRAEAGGSRQATRGRSAVGEPGCAALPPPAAAASQLHRPGSPLISAHTARLLPSPACARTWISMSAACPWAPPRGWWIMMRLLARL